MKEIPIGSGSRVKGIPISDKLEVWPIEKFKLYPNNPRLHDDQIEKLASLIRHHGFRDPILAMSDGEVVDGHFRIKAAQRLKMPRLPVILCDGLTKRQIRALRLSINRASEFADWASDALISELEELQVAFPDLDKLADLTGFETVEIEDILTPDTEEETDDDDSGIPKKLGTKREVDILAPGEDTENLADQSPIMEFRDDVQFDQVGVEGLPTLRKDMLLDCDAPVAWAGPEYSVKDAPLYMYSYMTETTVGLDWKKTIVGFYTSDKKFERLWTHTADIVTRFKNIKIKGIVTPDFSTFHGWPRALRAYNVYRSRWFGRYCQEAGIPIIVNVSGTDLDLEYSFDGLPGGCPMCIELQGRMTKDEVRRQTLILEAVLELRPRVLWIYASQEKLEQFPLLRQKKVKIAWIKPRMIQRRQEFERKQRGEGQNAKG
jgi:ParB-like chromosome segregation protein Spo0J